MRITEPYKLIANKKAPYEVYTLGRYFTVTGDAYGLEADVRTVTPKELEEILAIIGYPWGRSPITPIAPISQPTTPTTPAVSSTQKSGFSSAPATDKIPEGNTDNPIADEEILARMFRAKNGAEVKALYDGDTSAYGGDDSNADMALCSHLAFWAKKDPVMMERLWMMSPLGQREKTRERQDYRERTIHNAIANTKEVYQEKVKKDEESARLCGLLVVRYLPMHG